MKNPRYFFLITQKNGSKMRKGIENEIETFFFNQSACAYCSAFCALLLIE